LTDGLAKVAAKALHMSEPTLEELKDDKLKNDGAPLVCSISKQSYSPRRSWNLRTALGWDLHGTDLIHQTRTPKAYPP